MSIRKMCLVLLMATSSTAILTAQASELNQTTLTIPAGTRYIIPQGVTALHIDHLTMEDNTALIITPGAEHFEFIVKKSAFGKNSYIVAKGKNGNPGENGGRGTDLDIDLGVSSIHGLTIVTDGGKGGPGLQGLQGHNGEDARCDTMTPSQNGGQGGNGGNGGNGGDAGNITITLSKNSDYAKNYDLVALNYRQLGGQAGPGGEGGNGGEGGKGKAKCGYYPYNTSFPDAHEGPSGHPGNPGQSGRNASRTIQFN